MELFCTFIIFKNHNFLEIGRRDNNIYGECRKLYINSIRLMGAFVINFELFDIKEPV